MLEAMLPIPGEDLRMRPLGIAATLALLMSDGSRVRAAREALQAAIVADREEGYSPHRDPEHPMYNPAHVEDGPYNDWGIVWEDEEPKEEAGDGEDGEEENPRWRTIKDEGWD